jgi:CRISPR-associated protein (TIGR02584 family)
MKPEQFSKRILISVTGLSPQVLTETLYGLAVANPSPFIPTEIHLVTTVEGAHRAELDLLHPDNGKFKALCHEYDLPSMTFDSSNIHIITDKDGRNMEDIRTPAENEAAADFITQTLSSLTRDQEAAIHVSIAGGRKTMGYYLGYALSLFGRQQDRLSHVLVSEGYEGHPDFFYPTKKSSVIYTRDKRPLETDKAEISLAEIPFIRIREDIPQRLLDGEAGFSETINLALKIDEKPSLLIDLVSKSIFANDVMVKLDEVDLAFYYWVLDQTLEKEVQLSKPYEGDPKLCYRDQFLSHYVRVKGEDKDIQKTEDSLKRGMDKSFFEQRISRIGTRLRETLGKRLAEPFKITRRGPRGKSYYETGLSKEQIQFREE